VNTNLKRRALLGSAAAIALPLGAGIARAQEPTLTILSHKVHETVSRGLTPGTTGGDIESYAAAQRIAELTKYAMIVVSSLPLMIALPFMQKHFTKGAMIGAVK